MLFSYKVVTKEGKIKTGTIKAENEIEAIRNLKAQNFFILSIKEKKEIEIKLPSLIPSFLRKISFLDLVMFTKHLAVLNKAGVDLSESLNILKEQTPNRRLKKIISQIQENVSAGRSLSSSLAQFRDVFSQLYISMVEAGEKGGTLTENLEYLSIQMTKDFDLIRKVKTAMIYPIFILVATFSLGMGLSIYVLPKITDLFKVFKVPLPLSTRILLYVAEIFRAHGTTMIIGIILSIIFLRWFLRRDFVKPIYHKILLNLPLAGIIAKNLNLARLTRTLGSLLRSGLPISEALEITANTLNNVHYKNGLKRVRMGIETGTTVSPLLQAQEKLFPPVVSRMVGVGEKTGRLEEVLFYLTDFYEAEVDSATKNLSTILEPVLLVIIGVVVGAVAIAIISPIYRISGMLGR